MSREILILLSCGSVAYAWLRAVASPLARAARSMTQASTRATWIALALAIAAAVMWAAIVTAAILLVMMFEPRAGLAFTGSPLVSPGAAGGAAAWILQAAVTRRLPRFGDGFEAATHATVLEFCASMFPSAARRPARRIARPATAA